MQQKILLINSMEKLINHIVVSRKNQEEIFASLSKNDFKKIISNLEDQNQRLRKISLLLISQLLYNNNPLKEKFCCIMNIPTVPGRIALNTKLCPSGSRAKNTVTIDMSKNIKEVFTLLKQPITDSQKKSLFWYINFDNKNQSYLQLQYLSSSHPQGIQINDILDPIDSMVGFIMNQKGVHKKTENSQQGLVAEPRRKSQYEVNSSNRMVNNYFKPSGYKLDGFKNNTGPLNQSLNMTPGYSTDREPGYTKTIHTGVRGINTTMYHDSAYNYLNKSIQNTNSPPLNQIKTNTIETQGSNRSKYTGIKLISSTTNAPKGREAIKSFEQNPLFHGSYTSSNKGTGYSFGGLTGKTNPGRVERGYETLRDKKVLEKYPAE